MAWHVVEIADPLDDGPRDQAQKAVIVQRGVVWGFVVHESDLHEARGHFGEAQLGIIAVRALHASVNPIWRVLGPDRANEAGMDAIREVTRALLVMVKAGRIIVGLSPAERLWTVRACVVVD